MRAVTSLLTVTALVAGPAIIAAQDSSPLLVSPAWLSERVDSGLVLLAVGMDRSEYDAAHIAGARFVPLMSIHSHEGEALPIPVLTQAFERVGVSSQSRIVLYGAGPDTGPGMAFMALEYLGLRGRISILDGGLPAWRARGLPLTSATTPVTVGRLTPHPASDVVVDADYVRPRLGESSVSLVDARSRAEYLGTQSGDTRSGHLPGARHLEWSRTFDATGHLLSPNRLRQLFRDQGVVPGTQVIAYCTVGMRASHMYFVSRLLGYDTRIYVGGTNDWDRREGRFERRKDAGPGA